MRHLVRHFLASIIIAGLFSGITAQALAASETEELIVKSRLTAEKLLAHRDFPNLRDWIKKSKGVLIIPSLLKAGFLIGGSGGNGVMLSRNKDGDWSYPAFYTLTAASLGLQAGVSDAEVMLVIMSDGAMQALIDKEVTLGGDASIAIGTEGAGVKGATTLDLGKDIFSFSKEVGLYGGASVEGAWVRKREAFNTEYYGAKATPKEILLERKFSNPGADMLRAVLDIR
ncbi:MAG: lipid-binding SYLF domain-containing protein [Alphaproteobacteria bacterium]|nr:lipid-binding SYLF domain-containing protein [Alphaproteobacteria bacterium]